MPKKTPPRHLPRSLTAEQAAFVTTMPGGVALHEPAPDVPDKDMQSDGTNSVTESTSRSGDRSPGRLGAKSGKHGGRALFSRADGTERRKLSFYFEPDLAKQLHVYCVTHDIDMSSFVTSLVRRTIAKAT